MNAKIKNKNRRSRVTTAFSVVLLSALLAGCESSQMLDVSGLLSSDASKPVPVIVEENDADAKKQAQEANATDATADTGKTTTQTTGEENIVLSGPAPSTKTKTDAYPSLSEQPDKPGKTLNATEKNAEIKELEDLSKTHVQNREAGLDSRTKAPAKAKKRGDGGLFGLGWLGGGKTTASKTKNSGLTPPEKLRLSRQKAVAPEANNESDSISTGSTDAPKVTAGLRRTPILPSVPEKEVVTKPVKVAKQTPPQSSVAKKTQKLSNRPSAQNPKMIIFSNGSKKLTKKQQAPLDEIARFRDENGSNIYVLGFSQFDPSASNEDNIDSQDLAISRANLVADALRKRGFSSDQVVVQIIDEVTEKGKKSKVDSRRVEVYFENALSGKQPVKQAPKKAAKKSTLDFLKGKPFEYNESEN